MNLEYKINLVEEFRRLITDATYDSKIEQRKAFLDFIEVLENLQMWVPKYDPEEE